MRILVKRTTQALLLMAASVAVCTQPCCAADDFVVIANPANPADSISSSDLKKMFLGDKTSWGNGAKVTAATLAAESPDYNSAIKKATGMASADFKRYMLQMTFTGKPVTLPRGFDSGAAVAHFVSATPGAVGCVPASAAAAGVKVLKVE